MTKAQCKGILKEILKDTTDQTIESIANMMVNVQKEVLQDFARYLYVEYTFTDKEDLIMEKSENSIAFVNGKWCKQREIANGIDKKLDEFKVEHFFGIHHCR
jgi:hypothetical protein